ncbi:MAG: alpha-hydroxy acid oxidase [Pseudomonadota bacterium]
MDLDDRFPAISDLRARARWRMPHFAFEWLDSATGDESTHALNQSDLDTVRLRTGVLKGANKPDLTTDFMGHTYSMPVGIAPVGMSGVIWPYGEALLAKTAGEEQIAYCMSTMAAATPEELAPDLKGMGWFQLYPPGDHEIRKDILKRASDCGFHTLVLTVDVSTPSRRERQRRAQITQPMKITPRVALSCALSPLWSIAMLRRIRSHGWPRIETLEKYADVRASRPGTDHIGYELRIAPDLEYLKWLKDNWDGPIIVKGVLGVEQAEEILEAGADGLWISNHGGRQFSAAPSAVSALREVRAAIGPDVPIVFDSGARSGTDVLRAIACGADFIMLGRAWHWGLGALGEKGGAHVAHILRDSMKADMGQMAIERPRQVRERLILA